MADTTGSILVQAARAPAFTRLHAVPGVAWLLAVLGVAFGLAEPAFVAGANLNNVLMQSSVLLLLALPMTLIILTEGLDLSMGAALSLCTVVLAVVLLATGSLALSVALAILAALAVGTLNGILVAGFGLPPFVVTLGTLGVAQGLALLAAEGRGTMGMTPALRWFWEGRLLSMPVPLWLGAIVWAGMHLLLYRTRFGVRVVALGGNREALRFAGLPVNGTLMWVYALGGLCVGAASLLMTARIDGGNSGVAIGLEFDAIAAVAIGGTALRRGKGNLTGTVLGVLVVGVMRNGLSLLSLPSSIQVAAVGAVVIVSLAIDAARGKA
jgi:ribose transport system permease protein